MNSDSRIRLLACKWAAEALCSAGIEDIEFWRVVWIAAQYANRLASEEKLTRAKDAALGLLRTKTGVRKWNIRLASSVSLVCMTADEHLDTDMIIKQACAAAWAVATQEYANSPTVANRVGGKAWRTISKRYKSQLNAV